MDRVSQIFKFYVILNRRYTKIHKVKVTIGERIYFSCNSKHLGYYINQSAQVLSLVNYCNLKV